MFADFVIVRDFLEEAEIKSGFRLIYPLVDNLAQYGPCFDRMCYQDLSLHAWIAMTEEQKRDALDSHFELYEDEMRHIQLKTSLA